mgnify:CR=1 FL=1
MPEPVNLALARIVRLLEEARSVADALSDGMLAHLIDMAIIEAREQQGK